MLRIFTIFFTFLSWQLAAQEIVFVTQPATNKVGLNDPFEIRFSIKNAGNISSFSPPDFKDFQVLSGPAQSTSHSWINGQRSSSVDLTYVIKARKTGTLTITGATAIAEGKTIRSNSVNIEVIPGSVVEQRMQQQRRQRDPFFDDPFFDDPFGEDILAAMQRQQQLMMQQFRNRMQRHAPPAPQGQPSPQSSSPTAPITKQNLKDNLFIRVQVDKREAYLGEQITASYKLYTRVPMEVNLTKLPSLIGFWSQDFSIPQPPKPHREVLNGKEYQVFEIKRTALFPTQTGTLELDPAEAGGVARVMHSDASRRGYTEDDIISQFFGSMMMSDPDFTDPFGSISYEEVPVQLKSQPVAIQVKPLPSYNNATAFSGAVGKYNIESTINQTELTTDDNISLMYKITGTGNLKLISAPVISFPKTLDAYEPSIKDSITSTNNIIAGYKTFTYQLSPTQSGTVTIPEANFVYFDPELNEYKNLKTPSYTLQIKQGKKIPAQDVVPSDIHDIANKPIALDKASDTIWLKKPLYWSGFAVPFMAFVFLLAYKKKEDDLQKNQVLFKNKRANKVAMQRLALAEKYMKAKQQSLFYEETSKAVWLYLSDKLSIPLSALSKQMAMQKLDERHVSESLKAELFRITQECEMALYAADRGSFTMHQVYSDAFKLIGKLEEVLS